MHTTRRRRALLLGALASTLVATALSLGADPALAAYTAKVKAGTLTISGDGASDTLVLRLQAGSPTVLQLDVGGDGTADFSFDRSKFTKIDVQAGRGDDVVRIDQSAGSFPDEAVTLSGGPGADTLLGGSGTELLVGGDGDDVVAGGDANDRALLGDGADRFIWNAGDDSDVVEGGRGDDLLDFNGNGASETIGVTAAGGRVRFTRDVAAIVTDLDDVEHISFDAFGGTDRITVGNLVGTDATTVDIDLSAAAGGGDAQIDTVIVNGTAAPDNASVGSAEGRIVFAGLAVQTRIAGGEPHDELTLATLAGADTISAGLSLVGPAPVNVDGGDALDTIRYSGTAGADTISSFANGLEVSTYGPDSARVDSTAVENLTVLGLAGADTITAVGNLAALTNLTFDGGEDGDTLLGGNGPDLLLGGGGADHVDGNQGADTALLGDGDDRFQWDPGDGNDTVEGQAGNDRLDFNGSNVGEIVDVSANAGRVRFTRNIATIVTDLAGVEQIGFDAFGGADTITVNDLAGTDTTTVDIDLNASTGGGDTQIDTVTVNGTAGPDNASIGSAEGRLVFGGLTAQTRVTGDEAQDEITLATLAGEDTITMGVGAAAQAPVNVDGGEATDTVRYNGTADADSIQVVANGTEVSTVALATARLDTTAVESLIVLGLAGADTISAVGNLAALTTLTFDGGEDGDTLLGGNGPDVLLGGHGTDALDGNQGADQALGGDGDDRFQWDPGDGNDAAVDGQAGNDLLDFNGSGANEKIAIAANGQLARLTRDVAAITLDLANLEHVAVHAFGGTDTINVYPFAGLPVDTIDVDLGTIAGGGDGQIDNVLVHGTANADNVSVGSSAGSVAFSGLVSQVRVAGGEAHDEVTLATNAGEDTITAAIGIPGAAPVNIDGGDAADVLRYNGTAGADTIPVVANGAEVSIAEVASARIDTTAVENLTVLGQAGADTITAVGNLAALTTLTMDGGEDADTLLGGNGADLLLGGGGADHVDGNQGADQALLGDGNDRFQWDPGDGNDTVEGQAGNDTLDFNGSNIGEEIDVAAANGGVRFFRNIANITLDLDDVETVGFNALGGADTITVNDLTGTDTTIVDLDLNAFGGGGDTQADTVIVNGTGGADVVGVTRSGSQVLATGLAAQTRIGGSEALNDTLRIQTLGGNDDVSVGQDVSELITPAVDLGPDE